MWLLFTGISALDTYRLEVVTNVEFVPTLAFDSWSPALPSVLTTQDTTPMLKSLS